MYDALMAGLARLKTGTRPRKALLLVSDGGDNASTATLELVLKAFPVLQSAEIVAEMEQPARLHAAEHSLFGCGHGVFPAPRPTAVERIELERLWVKVLVMVWITWICGSSMISPTRMSMP